MNLTSDITIEFAPERRGSATAELRFRTDTQQNPTRTVALTGNGTAPNIDVSTRSVQLGALPVDNSNSSVISINNTGTAGVELNIS